MRLHISHKTHYTFAPAPLYGLQQLRLTPKTRGGHLVENWSIGIDGGVVEAEFTDFNNNVTHLVRLNENAQYLSVTSRGTVDVTSSNGILGEHHGFAPLWYFNRSTHLTEADSYVNNLLNGFSLEPENSLSSLHDLSALILENVSYETGQTESITTAGGAVALGKGVCQDHAHIFIAAARAQGIPARYVSGYLMMDDRIDQDATHAWAEAWVESLGWVGFDISNQVSPDEKYVRVASGLDYKQAAPISGVIFGQTDESVKVELQIQQQ